MADGTTRAIQDVNVGDKVVSTDPATGQTKAEPVTALHINHDTDLTDVTVRDDGVDRTTHSPNISAAHNHVVSEAITLHTTKYHPFYDLTAARWVNAANLKPGDRLRTVNGSTETVVRVNNHTATRIMRDLTIGSIHTYYVIAGTTPVLVHNCNGAYDWAPGNRPGLDTEPQGALPLARQSGADKPSLRASTTTW